MALPVIALGAFLADCLASHGFGGLWNEAGRCACGRDRLMPCCTARPDCVLVYWWRCEGCSEASEDGSGCEYEGGGINFAPNNRCLRDRPQR